jgi:hypothetical protein
VLVRLIDDGRNFFHRHLVLIDELVMMSTPASPDGALFCARIVGPFNPNESISVPGRARAE